MSAPEITRRAIEAGQQNGKIIFDELNELCGSGIDAKDIERIFNALSEAGIWVEEE